jgi:hypothetical protein
LPKRIVGKRRPDAKKEAQAMAGIASLGGVGAGLSQAQFQLQYQVQVLKEQKQVAESLGNVALDLIRQTLSGVPDTVTVRHDLDVSA